jgi:TPR repeat protein
LQGQYHEQGLGGLQPSAARAKKFYADAAAQGDRMAAMALDRLGGWLSHQGAHDDEAEGRRSSAATSDNATTSSSSSSRSGGSGVPGGRDAAAPRARRPLGSTAAT